MSHSVTQDTDAELAPIPHQLRRFCVDYLSKLNLKEGPAIIDLQLIDEFAVIQYTSMEYWRTRDPGLAVAGNVPLVVDLVNRRVYLRGVRVYLRGVRWTLSTCFEMIRRNDPEVTLLFRAMTEAEWDASSDPLAMLKELHTLGSGRKFRLFAVACARDMHTHSPGADKLYLHPTYGFEAAITAAEAYADGGERPSNGGGWLVALPVCDVISHEDIAYSALGFNADVGLWTTPSEQIVPEMISQYRVHPAHYLREVFGNPFRPVAFSPAWRTSTAVSLAKQMYDSRDFSPMPILADALQDAGCTNDDILSHCRDPKHVHVRGCWVIDLVLGKV
jgi:hypothetical protein